MRREHEEQARRMQELMILEAQRLKALMGENPDIERYAYMMLLGYRLISWAASAVSEVPGITSTALRVLAESQEERSVHKFDAAEMIKDLIENQIPWLESRRKDALMRERGRKGRLKAVIGAARNTVVPVPFKAIEDLFKDGDDGFSHTDVVLVYGPRDALDPVLRHCALHYQEQAGRAAMLSARDGDDGDERIAELTMPPSRWRNAGDVYGELVQVLDPIIKEQIKPYGLLVVEDLDALLRTTPIQEPRPRRLVRALACLLQFQAHYPLALIIGVATDDDPEMLEINQTYPPFMLMPPNLAVELQQSELAGGSVNVVIGDDVEPLYSMKQRLQPSGE